MERKRIVGTAGTFMVVAAMLAGGLAVPNPASAHCGGHPHPYLDGAVGTFTAGGVNIRTFPHAGCTSLGHGQNGDRAEYYCWAQSDGGTTWTYLRNLRTGVRGWVNDKFLSGNGSTFHCAG